MCWLFYLFINKTAKLFCKGKVFWVSRIEILLTAENNSLTLYIKQLLHLAHAICNLAQKPEKSKKWFLWSKWEYHLNEKKKPIGFTYYTYLSYWNIVDYSVKLVSDIRWWFYIFTDYTTFNLSLNTGYSLCAVQYLLVAY